MNQFKRFMLIVCVAASLAVLPAVSRAADADSTGVEGPRENALHPGMWALMFQIDEDIVPQPFNGMTIAVKLHRSRRSALRLGLHLGFNISEDTDDGWIVMDDTMSAGSEESRDENSQRATLEILYVRYPWPDAEINAFWGLGPYASFYRSRTESERLYDNPLGGSSSRSNYSYARDWTAGLRGIIGVEWFATRRISFHAEYQAVMYYRWGVRESESVSSGDVRRTERSSDDWSFSGSGVLFGLSMYF